MARRFALAIGVAFVLLAAGASPALAQPAVAVQADSPALAQARAFLRALTTDDEAGFLAFVSDNVRQPEPMTPDAWRDMRPNLAKLQFHSVVSATPTAADLLVYDGLREGWAHLVVNVQAEAPHAITRFGIRLGGRPADVPAPPKLAPAALADATKAKAEAAAARGLFSGAVLVAKDGKPILQQTYGLADRTAKTPVTLETQFRFGSMGKMFTAVAIMQLAQAGKLDLKAPIGRYLPGYPNQDIATKVTVENLLTHSGGTGDIFGPQFDANRLTLKEPADYIALYGARGPQFPPGTRQAYSNYGFILLGRIVETVSGESYDTYIAQRIFKPAGMSATGNAPETAHLPRRAVCYMSQKGQLKDAAGTLPWRGTPAGGGYSTVGDMLRFANALTGLKLMDKASLDKLTTGVLTAPDGTPFRYDFTSKTSEGRVYWGHGGGAPGMNGDLRIFPDSGHVVVVLANLDPPAAQSLASFISDRLP